MQRPVIHHAAFNAHVFVRTCKRVCLQTYTEHVQKNVLYYV